MIETMIKMWDRYGFVYLQGLTGTLCLAAITVFFGTLIGMILAIMRLSRVKPFQWFVRFYIWVLRGTPILLQLYFFWIFLPRVLPVKISDSSCIIIALIINASSYVAEVIRAGIQAVDKGQTEAARSLGMTGSHTMTQIILPQAIKNILPALGNEFIMMIKETSLASVLFINELMYTRTLLMSTKFLSWQPLFIIAIIYFIVTYSLSKVVGYMEKRLSVSD